MGDETEGESSIHETMSARAQSRYNIFLNTIQRRFSIVSIGVFGLIAWMGISLFVFGSIAGVYIMQYNPQANASTDQAYKPHSLFASVPRVVQLAGFIQGENDPRAAMLESYLFAKGSPMSSAAQTFVQVADQCPMDWTLLPAIAGKESSFGKIIPYNSYNAFGWAVYTGQTSGAVFDSWDHAVQIVGEGLCENYIKNGRNTPELIEVYYTPISANTHGGWRSDVSYFMDEIKHWWDK